MAKNYIDPEFGEMIGIAEVEKLTGISKASMRNWRKPEHHHLAKFDHYEVMGQRDVLYRLMDIEKFLAENGVQIGQSGLKRVEMPNASRAPMIDVKFVGDKHKAMGLISGISTETIYSWIQKNLNARGLSWVEQWQLNWRMVEDELKIKPHFILPDKRWENPDFWATAVHTARLITISESDIKGGLMIDDICQLNVGPVPPLNEKK